MNKNDEVRLDACAAIDHILGAPSQATPMPDASIWWQHDRCVRARWPRPIDASIAAGFAADCIAWAFASAYQSALRSLVPGLPADHSASFCVTEKGGNDPKAIITRVIEGEHGIRLEGSKSWIAAGPQRTMLLVLAAQGDTSEAADRPRLRIVAVASDQPGVRITAVASPRMLPELPQASARFDSVVLPSDALLAGDGHNRYVRAFRNLEPIHANAAFVAYVLREARARNWNRQVSQRALALLAAYATLGDADPRAASTEVVLAGVLEATGLLFEEADRLFGSATDETTLRWQRDRSLLTGMSTTRAARAERAWQRLASHTS